MWIEFQQVDILLTRTAVRLTGGFFLEHYSHNSIYLLVSHEHVQYASREVHIECFEVKDFSISVRIQGQETKFRNFNGNNWCDKRNLIIIIIMALQLSMQSFGLLNQFLPSSSILDKGLPIWHF